MTDIAPYTEAELKEWITKWDDDSMRRKIPHGMMMLRLCATALAYKTERDKLRKTLEAAPRHPRVEEASVGWRNGYGLWLDRVYATIKEIRS